MNIRSPSFSLRRRRTFVLSPLFCRVRPDSSPLKLSAVPDFDRRAILSRDTLLSRGLLPSLSASPSTLFHLHPTRLPEWSPVSSLSLLWLPTLLSLIRSPCLFYPSLYPPSALLVPFISPLSLCLTHLSTFSTPRLPSRTFRCVHKFTLGFDTSARSL